MKRFGLILCCLMVTVLFAAAKSDSSAKNDTIGITQQEVSKWISEPYVNSKGEKKVHYYAVWRGNLLTTSKTTIEKVTLCNKYNAKCALIVIGKRSANGSFQPKRITTN